MEKYSRAARRYLWEIRSWLPCSWKLKREILKRIGNTIREYLVENQNAAYEELTKRFGTPQQIAASYVEEMGTDELLRDLRIRRKVVRAVTAAALAVAILWAGFIGAAYVDHVNDVNGYLVIGEIIEIEETEID